MDINGRCFLVWRKKILTCALTTRVTLLPSTCLPANLHVQIRDIVDMLVDLDICQCIWHTHFWKDACLHFIWCNYQGASHLPSSWYWVTCYCGIFLDFALKYFQVLYLVTIELNSKLLTNFFEVWNVFFFLLSLTLPRSVPQNVFSFCDSFSAAAHKVW